jgi:hypothetical protein
MSRLFILVLTIQTALTCGVQAESPRTYPRGVVPAHLTPRRTNNYDVLYAENRVRSGIPLGGIGAGFVELRKDGTFYNWMIANNIPKGVGDFLDFPDPQGLDRDPGEAVMFFLLRFQEQGEPPHLRILSMHRSEDEAGVSQYNIRYIVPWLTAVDRIESSAQFPFIRFQFADEAMPLGVSMEAFSSFVPGDLELSTTPGASFRFAIQSTADTPVDVTLVGILRNLVGYSVPNKLLRSRATRDDATTTIEHYADHVDPRRPDWGTMALGVDDPAATFYLGWAHQHPFYPYLLRNSELPNIDDTFGKRRFLETSNRANAAEDPLPWLPDLAGRVRKGPDGLEYSANDIRGALAVHRRLAPGQSWEPIYALGWHFPNSYGSRAHVEAALQSDPASETPKGLRGHYYSRHFDSATGVTRTLLAQQDKRTGERVPERRELDDRLCFADQLLGRLWLELVGGGPVFDAANERVALQTIVDTNLYRGIGLINLRDPRRADRTMEINAYNWIDQPNTLFTGVEFATAANLLYAGMYDQAMQVLEPLDARHRKNGCYWNHQEAFNHYLRSMSGWMVLDGALGLSIDRGTYTFSPKLPGKSSTLFMSVPGCCGTFRAADGGVSIKTVIGSWRPKRVVVDSRLVPKKTPVVCLDGSQQSAEISRLQDQLIINLPDSFSVDQGRTLVIR